ncbi:MAG: hypothetical protein R3F24_00480 [Gammaproteobacteria bacterium]
MRKSLKKKGFVEVKDSHHIYLHHEVDGKRTGATTHCSHGAGSEVIGDELVDRIKRQLRLTKAAQVRDLVNCPLSADGYVNILRETGVLPT